MSNSKKALRNFINASQWTSYSHWLRFSKTSAEKKQELNTYMKNKHIKYLQ